VFTVLRLYGLLFDDVVMTLSLIFTIIFIVSLIWAVILTLGTIRVLFKLARRKISPQNEESASLV